MSSSNSLFVTGCFRSGTSLLYACLNQHPDIAIMYETGLCSIPLSEKLIYHTRWLENANAWGKFLSRHGFSSQPSDVTNLGDANQIYKAYAAKNGARYFGEKCPTLMTNLRKLVKEYPKAKIITIFRHPLEIQNSVIKAGLNDSFFSDSQILNRQLYAQEKMYQDARELLEEGYDILHISYAELCEQPEVTCRKICAYLEIPYTDRMIDLTGADLSAVYSAKHHMKLFEGRIERFPQAKVDASSRLYLSFEALAFRWDRMRNYLLNKGDESVFSEPLDSVSRSLIRQGARSCQKLRIKRRIYHLAPAETIRFFRAIKIMMIDLRELGDESVTPKQKRNNCFLACFLVLIFISSGLLLNIISRGILSPLLVYLLAPIRAAWLMGELSAMIVVLLSVLAYCLCEMYTPPSDSIFSFIWNFFTRLAAFSIVLFFTLHLKVTFLRFQKNISKN